MTIASEAMTEAPARATPTAPRTLPVARLFCWSVRRELWENRSLYIAPLAAAAVMLLGFLLGAHRTLVSMPGLDPALQARGLARPYDAAAGVIMFTALIVAVFYCLGALHNERRDRSILFWKSLPVSDLVTVLSKASVPLVVLPLISFAIIIATGLVMIVLSTVILLLNGMSVIPLWTQLPLVQMSLVVLYGLAVISLWYAPIYGWLLLVSAWARRAAFLWALLPPLALCVVEKIAFDTSHVWGLIAYRFGGFTDAFNHGAFSRRGQAAGVTDPLAQVDLAGFLATPGLWAGLAVAAAFLAAAVWLRHRREPL